MIDYVQLASELQRIDRDRAEIDKEFKKMKEELRKYEGIKETLRDRFAGQAMAALVTVQGTFDRHYLSREAYDIADAMLEARDGR